jgi:hypothetical protein
VDFVSVRRESRCTYSSRDALAFAKRRLNEHSASRESAAIVMLPPSAETISVRTWTAQNFDVDGEHIPALDAEGVVSGVRLTVD